MKKIIKKETIYVNQMKLYTQMYNDKYRSHPHHMKITTSFSAPVGYKITNTNKLLTTSNNDNY